MGECVSYVIKDHMFCWLFLTNFKGIFSENIAGIFGAIHRSQEIDFRLDLQGQEKQSESQIKKC